MANIRQYIGARYTIKIYENSQDASSAEWEANTSYEPLVMVTYNNSSYLSKKDVPATIGNPAQNPTYWIVTGAYNGQIAALQAQIDAINNNELPAITADIQTLTNGLNTVTNIVNDLENLPLFSKMYKNKNFVIYGDSLSSYEEDWVTPFTELVESLDGTVTNHAGAGARTQDQLTLAQADANEYDVAIIWLGINDSNTGTPLGSVGTSGTFSYYYNQLINAIRTVSPNCQIFGLGMPYHTRLSYDALKSLYYYSNCISDMCTLTGAVFKTMDDLPNNNTTATSDGIHFTEEYSQSTVLYAIVNKLCNPTIEHNATRHLKIVSPENLLSDIASGVSIVAMDAIMSSDGMCNLTVVFDASGVSTTTLFKVADPIRPLNVTYIDGDGVFCSYSSNGNVSTNANIGDGRHTLVFNFMPKWVIQYNATIS